MKNIIQSAIISILFCSALFADDYKIALEKALNLSYNFDFKNAENQLGELLKQQPDDPVVYLHLSNIAVWKYLSDNDEEYYKQFEKYSQQTINKSIKILTLNDNDLNARYCYLNILGYKALIYLLNKNYIEGIWKAKECLSSTNSFIKNNPQNYDVLMWSGLFNFALSQIPTGFKSVLKLAGIEGDFNKGIKELKIASQFGARNRIESKYFLSQIYSSYSDIKPESNNLLKEIFQLYPENILIKYSLASEMIKNGKLFEAEKLLTEIINTKTIKYKKINSLSYFLLGDIAFFSGKYNSAINNYKKYFSLNADKDYIVTAKYRMGMSYQYLNLDNFSKNCFEEIDDYDGVNEEGEYYKTKAEVYTQRNLSTNELLLQLIENSIKSNEFNKTDSLLNVYNGKYYDVQSRSTMHYYNGLKFVKMNNLSHAFDEFEKVNSSFEYEEWMIWHSKYMRSKILFENKKYYEAGLIIENVLKNKSKYFNNFINAKTMFIKFQIEGQK